MSVEITDSSGPLRSTDSIYGRIAGQPAKSFSPDLIYDFIKTQTDRLYPTQSALSSLDDYVTSFTLQKNSSDNTKWDGQSLTARGFASATEPADLVVYQQLQDAVLASTFDIQHLTPIDTIDSVADMLLLWDDSAASYRRASPNEFISGLDEDLAAIAALSGTGFSARTASNTWALRTMQPPAAGITITNPAGVAGDPTLALANDLAAVEGLSSTGLAVRTASDAWAQRQVAAPAAGITITNPAGVAGDITLALANDLSALEALSSTGFAVRTATDTWAQRSLTAPAAGLTISNNTGVAGNPTFALANDLSALEGLASTGFAARTTTDTWAQRTITGTSAEITVTNGDGVSGNPTLSLPSALTFTGKTITGGTFASPAAITGLPDPTAAQDVATKAYVDSVSAGLDIKPSVKAATTANITLSGAQTIDGVALVAGDRCLAKNQSTTANNGIYVVASGSWTRATDMDAWAEVPGAFVFVEQGTTYADTAWVCTADTGGTIGSTSITWSQFAGVGTYTATGGVTLTGTQFSITTNGITNAMLRQSSALSVVGVTGSSTANVADISGTANQVLRVNGAGTSLAFGAIDISSASAVSGILAVGNGGLGASLSATGGTSQVLRQSSAGAAITVSQLAIADISGWATGIATWLGSPTSANLAASITDETGSGPLVFGTSPSLTTPSLSGETFSTSATITAGTNAQGQGALTSDYNVVTTAASNPSGVTLPVATTGRRIVVVNRGANVVNVYPASGGAIDGLATNASIQIAVNGSMFFNASSTTQWYSSANQTFSAPTLGTPASVTLTNGTGLPVSTGISGLGSGVATLLATFSSANLAAALNDETGSGAAVFGTAPTISSGVMTGTLDVQQAVKWSGSITPTALSGDVNDYAPTGFSTVTVVRQDGGVADRNITGLAGGVDGLVKVLLNSGSTNSLVLVDGSASSTAANRFAFGASLTLAPNQGCILRYDGTLARWTAMGVFLSSGGSSGTVTSIAPGGGLTSTLTATAPGSSITSSGTLSTASLVNAQTGTTYTVLDSDRAKTVTLSNTASIAVTLPQAGATSAFQAGWFSTFKNLNRGAVTITPTTSTINGAATLVLQRGQSAVIVSDGTNYQATTARPNIVVQTFTGSGTYTPTAGMSYCEIYCLGGGGGGGGVAGATNELRQAGGGGAGSLSMKVATAADIGASQTVTIGAAGTAGSAGANTGGSGGDTSVGSLCIGKGGGGGGGTSTAGSAGTGGAAGTGNLTGTGAPGFYGGYHNAAGTYSILIPGGNGGSSQFGGAGAGGGPSGGSASAGAAATGYGAGGGGATATNVAANAAGGAGSPGLAWIVEYIS